jgi:hypothetical protein
MHVYSHDIVLGCSQLDGGLDDIDDLVCRKYSWQNPSCIAAYVQGKTSWRDIRYDVFR